MELGAKVVKKYWFLLAVLSIVLVFTFLFMLGYRIGPGGVIAKSGAVVVSGVPLGSTLYLDAIRNQKVGKDETILYLFPSAHELVVDAEGFHPWNELVEVTAGETQYVTPLLIPETLTETLVEETRVQEATALLRNASLPTRENPLLVSSGCVRVYVSGNRIVGERTGQEGCTSVPYLCTDEGIAEYGACLPTIIFEPQEALTNFILYPGRDDALIVASGNLAYVIELDPREPRFFAPLARSQGMRIAPWSDSSILINAGTEPRELPL